MRLFKLQLRLAIDGDMHLRIHGHGYRILRRLTNSRHGSIQASFL